MLPSTVEFFNKHAGSKDGLRGFCRECNKRTSKRRYDTHKEECSERAKIYYRENKEHLRNKSKEYRLEHLDDIREYRLKRKEELKIY